MKKLIAILTIFFLTAAPALASEVGAGVTPNSPFYWFDRLAERVQLLFTLDPQAKVQALQRIGLERLAEAQQVEDPKTVGELISAYRANQEEAEAAAGGSAEGLTTVSDGLTAAIDKLQELLQTAKAEGREKAAAALEKAISKLTKTSERLEKLAQKMPEKAKEKAAKAAQKAQERLARLEEKLSKAKEKAETEGQGGQKSLDELINKIKEATAKHTAVLQRVLEKAPEPAKEALQKALEKSQQGGQRAVEAVKKRLENQLNQEPGEDESVTAETDLKSSRKPAIKEIKGKRIPRHGQDE